MAESNRDDAFLINSTAVGVIGEEGAKIGAIVIHFSTDYVFDGSSHKAYVESDATKPLNVYGLSKLSGEKKLIQTDVKYFIFRTSWVYGPRGNNFLITILNLAKEREDLKIISDQYGAPTSSLLIANSIKNIIEKFGYDGLKKKPSGIYHLTAHGCVSWYEFAIYIIKIALMLKFQIKCLQQNVKCVSSVEFVQKANRPPNSVLSTDKFTKCFGIELPDWKRDVLEVCQIIDKRKKW